MKLFLLLLLAVQVIGAGGAPAHPVCDGTADDTAAIQAALNIAGAVRLPAGTCLVRPLFVRSDTTIEFTPQTILRSAAEYKDGESLLTIAGAANVTVRGNGGAIVMNRAEYTSGERRHGVLIQGSAGVRIYDLISSGSGGDGFYIGASAGRPFSEDVELHRCVADGNRRNGLSVVSAKNALIDGGEFRGTSGTLPESGIDVEPNGPSDGMENIRIRGVLTSHNHGGGITVAPSGLGAAKGKSISVDIDGFTSREDGGNGTGGGIRLAMPGPPFRLAYEIAGEIRISNAVVIDPSAWGVAVERWVALAPRAVFRDVTVYTPNAKGTGTADFGWSGAENAIAANSGFVVALTSAETGAGSRRVEFRRCRAEDRRPKPTMQHPFYLHSANGTAIDAVFEDR
jgi:hypothetical protein